MVHDIRGGGRVLAPATPGRRYLAVVATLRNDGTVPGRLRNELDVRGIPNKEFFGVWRFRDGSQIQNLGPGLEEQLVFAWTIPETALSFGDAVTVRVWKKKYTQLMVTYGGQEWIDSETEYGETVLTVAGRS